MILQTSMPFLGELPEYSVLIHPVNCEAKINFGAMQAIARKHRDWYPAYRSYCLWFIDGHEKEILGTFHRYEVSPTHLVCSCFVQVHSMKGVDSAAHDSWRKVLKKIELQTRRANAAGKPWTLHFDARFCNTRYGEDTELIEIINEIFAESPVKLYMHSSK